MAYDFSVGDHSYFCNLTLTAGQFPAVAPPMTVSLWFKRTGTLSVGVNHGLFNLYSTTGGSQLGLFSAISGETPQLYAWEFDGDIGGYSIYTIADDSVWNHAAGVFTSSSSRRAYLNGSAATADTTSVQPVDLGWPFIGAMETVSRAYPGHIGEVAVWNAALTAGEITALSKGSNPVRIRPGSLVAYWPLNDGFAAASPFYTSRFKSTAYNGFTVVNTNTLVSGPPVAPPFASSRWGWRGSFTPPAYAAPLVVSSPVLGAGVLTQAQVLSASALTVIPPVLDLAFLNRRELLTSGLVVGSPSIGIPALAPLRYETISIVDVPAGAVTTNGTNVSVPLPTASMQADTDWIYIFGGHYYRSGVSIGPTTGSWQELYSENAGGSTHAFGAWRKKWDGSESSVACYGSGTSGDGSAYMRIIVRNGSAVDVAAVAATGSSTNPNPPAITPNTNGAMVLIAAQSAVSDNSPGTVGGGVYTVGNVNASTTNDMSLACGYRLGLPAGVQEDPANWSSWTTGNWRAITLAIRPADQLLANGFVASSPDIGVANTTTANILTASSLTVEPPFFGGLVVHQNHSLSAIGITTLSPAIDTTALTKTLSPVGFTTVAPTLGAQPLRQVHIFSTASLTTASPVLGLGSFGRILAATGLTTPSPVVGQAALSKTLTASALTVLAPVINATSLTYALSAVNLTVLPPVIDIGIGTQGALTMGVPITVGSPVIGSPALHQVQILVPTGKVVQSPVIGVPLFVQCYPFGDIAVDIVVESPAFSVPLFTKVDVLPPPVGITVGSPRFGFEDDPRVKYALEDWYKPDGTKRQIALFVNYNSDTWLEVKSGLVGLGDEWGETRSKARRIHVEAPLIVRNNKLYIDENVLLGEVKQDVVDLQSDVSVLQGDVSNLQVSTRQIIGVTTNFYVDVTNGSDENDGSSGSKWATLRHALAYVAAHDIQAETTINLADGDYTGEGFLIIPGMVGSGLGHVSIIGNLTAPANVVLRSLSTFQTIDIAFLIRGMKFDTGGAAGHVINNNECQIWLNTVIFAACNANNAHIRCAHGATVEMYDGYTVAGGGKFHLFAEQGGAIFYWPIPMEGSPHVVMQNNPAFTTFAHATDGGIIQSSVVVFGSGVTGKRYRAENNGIINTYGSGINYFPGDVAGDTATGGQYL